MIVNASTYLSNKLDVPTHSAVAVSWVSWRYYPGMPSPHGGFGGSNSDCCSPSQTKIRERWAEGQTVSKVSRMGWNRKRTKTNHLCAGLLVHQDMGHDHAAPAPTTGPDQHQ